MAIEIHVMGDYWAPIRDERTDLGDLVHRAKDLGDPAAATLLADRFAAFLGTIVPVATAVVPVPASPDRPSDLLAIVAGDRARPMVERRAATVRLRDLAPEDRPAVVDAGGYEVTAACGGLHLVLLDDVVLTGTTLQHVGGLLLAAGAASVVGVALARTRRR